MDPLNSLSPTVNLPGDATTDFGPDHRPGAIATIPDGPAQYLAEIRRLDLEKVQDAWDIPCWYSFSYSLQHPWVRNFRWKPEGLVGL
jgi:hypothetical protein